MEKRARFREIGKRINPIEELEDISKEIFSHIDKTIHPKKTRGLTPGQKASDFLTRWAGSWFFIFLFLGFILIWMTLNVYLLIYHATGKPWDPYPFILLNLVLSCLAAIQAPIILMSQNRQTQRDRLMAEYDYRVNKKAEKEIQHMQKQLDRIEKKIN